MARGYPDYSRNVGRTPEGKFLVQSATSPTWFEDDMEGATMKWIAITGTVAFTTVAASGTTESDVFAGDQALKITSAAGDICRAVRTIGGMPESSDISMEVTFRFTESDDFSNAEDSLILLKLFYRNGTQKITCGITYNPRDGKWYFFDSAGNRTLIGTYEIKEKNWHFGRLTINPVDQKYREFRIDNKVYDLTANAMLVETSTLAIETNIILEVTGDTSDTAIMIIDNIKVRYSDS